MTIDPAHHIYSIQLTENVFQWNLFISNISGAGMVQAWVGQETLKDNILRVFTVSDLLNI